MPERVRHARRDCAESLLKDLVNGVAQVQLLWLELLKRAAPHHDGNFELCIDICAKYDVHHEALQDLQKLARHVELCHAVGTGCDVIDPLLLLLPDVILELVKHHLQLVFVEGMRYSLSLVLPLLV